MNMILTSVDFFYEGFLYFRDYRHGRCYRQAAPSGLCDEAAGAGKPKRISRAQYDECLAACRRSVEGGAA
jgi:hypothetical protein